MSLVLLGAELPNDYPAYGAWSVSHKTCLIKSGNNQEMEGVTSRRHLRACRSMIKSPKFVRLVISLAVERTADLL